MELILLPNFYGLNSLTNDNKDEYKAFRDRLIKEIYEVYKNEDDYILFKLINKALQYDPPKLKDKKITLNIDDVNVELFEPDRKQKIRTLWSYLEYYKMFYRTNSKRTRKVKLDECYPLDNFYGIV